jgi:hypothetical protein
MFASRANGTRSSSALNTRISRFRCIQASYGIENIDIALHIAPAAEKPVDILNIPHEKREGAGVIAGN